MTAAFKRSPHFRSQDVAVSDLHEPAIQGTVDAVLPDDNYLLGMQKSNIPINWFPVATQEGYSRQIIPEDQDLKESSSLEPHWFE